MGWLIALGVLTLLAVLPVGVKALYGEEGFFLSLIIGPVKVRIFPARDKKKKAKKEQPPASADKKTEDQEKKRGKLSDFLPIVQTALEFLKGFFKAVRIRLLELDIAVGGDDPCDIAVNYGRLWAAVSNALPILEKFLTVKKRKIDITCDFTLEQTKVYARVDAVIGLGVLLVLVLRYGLKILFAYNSINNSRKGGINNEPEST